MSKKEALPDAKRYADEARTLRALAQQAKDPDVRRQMLRVATLYDKLAELVEEAAFHTLTTAALVATRGLSQGGNND
jgi:hypothetical protein